LKRWLLILLALPLTTSAQNTLQYSVSNLLRYGTGEERVLTVAQRRDYFENLTDAKISISDFQVGFRLLFDSPPEFGLDSSGLRKRFLEFTRDDLRIRAGNSFTLYGRGLALNLFENRALGFDNGLDGVKMEYKTRVMKFGVTAGDVRYADILDLSRIEYYRLRAGTLELTPYPFLSLGVNFVSGKTTERNSPLVLEGAKFDIPEYFGRVSLFGADLFVSYAEKRTLVNFDTLGTHKGTAFYGSLGYSEENFGFSLEYKDYRFGESNPAVRNDVRAKRALAFQNAPIVHKEHTFTLLSRYPHVIDFSDEVGFQLDVFYALFGHLTGNLNLSQSSRHYSYDAVDTTAFFPAVFVSTDRKNNWLPTLNSRYSPFWEIYFDAQYYFEEGGSDYVLLGFNRRSDDISYEATMIGFRKPAIKSTRTTSIPFSGQYGIGEWTVKLGIERQWVYEDANTVNHSYYNQLLSVGFANSPTYSVTFRYELTSDYGTIDQRRFWGALDASYKLSPSHLVTLTVGGDRGGQVCANGVCRIVNPFYGVRASVTSYL
jgi:hypothetical protein